MSSSEVEQTMPAIDTRSSVRYLYFWRDMLLYFWVFSAIGHVLELAWGYAGVLLGLKTVEKFATVPLFAIAAPYGLGVLGIIIFIYPLVKKHKLGLVGSFFLSVAITSLIELICSLAIVAVLGNNPYWDYSNRFMNLGGHICLANSIAFGIVSVLALKFIFPYTEKWRSEIPAKYLNLAFITLATGYAITLATKL